MLFPGNELCNRYKLEELIDRGGMGEVWLAKDRVLERKVAIKSINSKLLAGDPGIISIFRDEARIGASLLGHPNIVTILDYGTHKSNDSDEEYFIVMEYVEGLNVETFIKSVKPVIDEETYYYISLLIAWEMGRAIDYAHKEGIFHRDIKPLNAFISKYGIAKVGDFGLARFVDAVTRTHTVNNFNSPPYCAPEQWKGAKYETDTDIYQLGCTLYHLFTGRFIFEKNNNFAQMYAHINEEPKIPGDFCEKMTQDLSNIILKMVNKQIGERGSLWELNDTIAKELQRTFELHVSADKEDEEKIKKICEITDFSEDRLKGKGEASFEFPDFNEILSEGLQLILNDITSFNIVALKEEKEPQTS